MKYQDESTNVSIVSVSRSAAPPHVGHVTLTQSSAVASGERPFGATSSMSGSTTGSSASAAADRRRAAPPPGEPRHDLLLRLGAREAVEAAGVDERLVVGVRRVRAR